MKKRASLWLILRLMLIFFVVTLPLFVFDLVHNFDNILMPLRLITNRGSQSVIDPLSRLPSLVRSFSKIWFNTNNPIIQNAFFCIFFLFLAFTVINNKKISTGIIAFIIVSFSLAFLFFPSPMQEYYLVLILPFVIIISAMAFRSRPIITYPLLTVLIIFNSLTFINKPILGDYKTKMNVITNVKKVVKNDPFDLEIQGAYIFNGGWRYLFQSAGLTPGTSSADSVFGWIYPDEISTKKPKYKVTIMSNQEYIITKF